MRVSPPKALWSIRVSPPKARKSMWVSPSEALRSMWVYIPKALRSMPVSPQKTSRCVRVSLLKALSSMQVSPPRVTIARRTLDGTYPLWAVWVFVVVWGYEKPRGCLWPYEAAWWCVSFGLCGPGLVCFGQVWNLFELYGCVELCRCMGRVGVWGCVGVWGFLRWCDYMDNLCSCLGVGLCGATHCLYGAFVGHFVCVGFSCGPSPLRHTREQWELTLCVRFCCHYDIPESSGRWCSYHLWYACIKFFYSTFFLYIIVVHNE